MTVLLFDEMGILDAHLLMMQDPLLFDEMQKGILEENHAGRMGPPSSSKNTRFVSTNG